MSAGSWTGDPPRPGYARDTNATVSVVEVVTGSRLFMGQPVTRSHLGRLHGRCSIRRLCMIKRAPRSPAAQPRKTPDDHRCLFPRGSGSRVRGHGQRRQDRMVVLAVRAGRYRDNNTASHRRRRCAPGRRRENPMRPRLATGRALPTLQLPGGQPVHSVGLPESRHAG